MAKKIVPSSKVTRQGTLMIKKCTLHISKMLIVKIQFARYRFNQYVTLNTSALFLLAK